jgi:DNA polymerase-3 subunit delta
MAAPRPASSKCSGTYIFLGPELGKKQNAIVELRKKLSGGHQEETVYYAGETAVSQMASEIQNQSLFAETRLFMVKNAELIKKKEEIDLLVSCIQELDEGTVLILVSDETRIAAGFDDAVPRENRQVFYELFESEKNRWVQDFFRQQGFSIDSDGIETVLEMVENNTESLARECSRLMLFLRQPGGGTQTVSADQVEQWLSHYRQESAFTLFSRIAAGDLLKAMEAMRAILSARDSAQGIRDPAQGILSGLAWCFRKLREYQSLLESGKVNPFELKKIGLAAPKARDEYAAAARRYSAARVDVCLALTAEYEILLRSLGNQLEAVLMDTYILKIFDIN